MHNQSSGKSKIIFRVLFKLMKNPTGPDLHRNLLLVNLCETKQDIKYSVCITQQNAFSMLLLGHGHLPKPSVAQADRSDKKMATAAQILNLPKNKIFNAIHLKALIPKLMPYQI